MGLYSPNKRLVITNLMDHGRSKCNIPWFNLYTHRWKLPSNTNEYAEQLIDQISWNHEADVRSFYYRIDNGYMYVARPSLAFVVFIKNLLGINPDVRDGDLTAPPAPKVKKAKKDPCPIERHYESNTCFKAVQDRNKIAKAVKAGTLTPAQGAARVAWIRMRSADYVSPSARRAMRQVTA